MVSVVPWVRFTRIVRLAPPSPAQHAVRVVGETFLRRDLHPARSAKLRLAHERWRSPAAGSGSAADAGGSQVQGVVETVEKPPNLKSQHA